MYKKGEAHKENYKMAPDEVKKGGLVWKKNR